LISLRCPASYRFRRDRTRFYAGLFLITAAISELLKKKRTARRIFSRFSDG
jgi:hypothetical protein